MLINGCTSFTGYWFAKTLIESKKYKVVIIIRKKKKEYYGLNKKRLNLLKPYKIHVNVEFGSKKFLNILNKYNNFKYIHHSTYTKNYQDDNKFDYSEAVSKNLRNISKFFKILKRKKCKTIIISESYFQKFGKYKTYNLYASSKEETTKIFVRYCNKYKIKIKKNRIANPFGPLEEKRFIYYLISKWKKNKTPLIKNPKDKNDFVPIEILAKKFLNFIKNKKKILNISGVYMSNYNFAKIFKKELEKKLGKKLFLKKIDSIKKFDRKNSNLALNKTIFINHLRNYLEYYIKNY